MHSSRMRTGRSLTVCCSLLHAGGGGVSLVQGGVCLVGGGSPWSRGGLPGLGGVCLVPGGVCLVRGVSAWSLVGLPGDPLPPVDRITDTCKNITLATTSLRPVINSVEIYHQTKHRRSSTIFKHQTHENILMSGYSITDKAFKMLRLFSSKKM